MKNISHSEQRRIWEEEHRNPHVLPPIGMEKPSSGVIQFWEWLQQREKSKDLRGVEMGCGKGRNAIFLAKQKVHMTGFDFAPSAIEEAQKRARSNHVGEKTTFLVHDATQSWTFPDAHFDFAMDNFASTDIETPDGRSFAREEMVRVVKPGGYVYVCVLSDDDLAFKRELTDALEEPNAYRYKEGAKFEKSFSEEDIERFFPGLKCLAKERIQKQANFFGTLYPCLHWWLVFQKPA